MIANNFITSPRGLKLIKSFEGCRLTAYQCPAGIWSIGYGHTRGTKRGLLIPQRGLTITQDQAEYLLKLDLQRFEDGVTTLVQVPLEQHEFDALVSFSFNVGTAAFQRSTLLKKLNKGDRLGAAEDFLRWDRVKGKVVPGLTRRREKERLLFLGAS